MVIDHINAYRKPDTSETTDKVISNIQGEVSPPQVIDINSSAPTAHQGQNQLNFRSPPATFLGNKDDLLEILHKYASYLNP